MKKKIAGKPKSVSNTRRIFTVEIILKHVSLNIIKLTVNSDVKFDVKNDIITEVNYST